MEKKMRLNLFVVAISALALVPLQCLAQSTITLDSFSLDEDEPGAVASRPGLVQDGTRSCLVDPNQTRCGDVEASSYTFSLADVVNLGIVERSELEGDDGQGIQVADRVEPLPSIDLEILFDYNSAELRNDQLASLVTLATDLRSVDFQQASLIVMGHTDAIGSAAFNRDLSLRRAQTVAQLLSGTGGIPPARIRTAGAGFDYLRYPNAPDHPGNRRVQILLVQ